MQTTQCALCALGVALGMASAGASPAYAAPDGSISYSVKRGDTLYDLSREYLTGPAAIRQVQRLNRIRNPRTLRIGRVLTIPRALLKHEDVNLELQSFSGPVALSMRGRTITPQLGLKMREGLEISTGNRGFVAIGGADNSRVSIPSNSRARIVDARRYLINGKIDIQLRVLKGRGEVVAPKIDGDARYRVGTPVAVTAVRGTEFRVAYEPDSEVSLAEVVEGAVEVAVGEATTSPEAGFGVAATPGAVGSVERLLEPPVVIDAGRIQTEELVNLDIAPLDGASGYRTQIARDAGFVEVVEETLGSDTQISFAELEDGRYFVRARGVSQVGLEGLSKASTFRRKRLSAEGGVEESPLADAFKFAWRSVGSGQSYSAFQLWRDDAQDTLLVDEVGLENSAILVSNLSPAKYKWRVATFQIDEGEVIKVWGPAQELEVTE